MGAKKRGDFLKRTEREKGRQGKTRTTCVRWDLSKGQEGWGITTILRGGESINEKKGIQEMLLRGRGHNCHLGWIKPGTRGFQETTPRRVILSEFHGSPQETLNSMSRKVITTTF